MYCSPLPQKELGWGCLGCRCGKVPAELWLSPLMPGAGLPQAPRNFPCSTQGCLSPLPGNSSGIHSRLAAAWPGGHLLRLAPGPGLLGGGRGQRRREWVPFFPGSSTGDISEPFLPLGTNGEGLVDTAICWSLVITASQYGSTLAHSDLQSPGLPGQSGGRPRSPCTRTPAVEPGYLKL